MAQSFLGNLTRNVGLSISAHHRRLAELSMQSATTLRELATYHQSLAAGIPSTPPIGGTLFESGTGAPEPTNQELNALVAQARTAADHHALEEYFLMLANRYAEAADTHVAMAQTYRGTRMAQAADHCDRLVKRFRDLAKEATGSASIHKELAEWLRMSAPATKMPGPTPYKDGSRNDSWLHRIDQATTAETPAKVLGRSVNGPLEDNDKAAILLAIDNCRPLGSPEAQSRPQPRNAWAERSEES